MFGYIRVNKMDLTYREFEIYKGYYCGMCKYLKRNHTEISRFSINYDITFLILILSSVYEMKTEVFEEGCVVNPIKRKKHLINEATEYAASMNILLAYYKLMDNVEDDGRFVDVLAERAFRKSFKTAYDKYPDKAEKIKYYLDELSKLEKDDVRNIDLASNTFGELMREIFSYREDDKKEMLGQIGFNAGKYVYVMDAFEDLGEDVRKNRYNPFKPTSCENLSLAEIYSDELKKRVDSIIGYCLAGMERGVMYFDPKWNRGIIDNIIYSGIYLRYKNVLYNKPEKNREENEEEYKV